LASAHFSVERLTGIWGSEADAALLRGHRVPALRALEATQSRAGTLARLFVLGLPAAVEQLDAALPTLHADGAVALGLVRLDGGTAVPLLGVRPYGLFYAHVAGSFVLASALGELALAHALPEGHVLGVGGASRTVSGLTVRDRVAWVLELGTGCGIQALHA